MQWAVTPAGDIVDVEGNIYVFYLQHPGIFGITADDVSFMRSHQFDGDALYALLDKVMMVGLIDDKQDTRPGDHDTPSMLIEHQGGLELICIFGRESEAMYNRLMKFVAGHPGVPPDGFVTLKEWHSQRIWRQRIATILKGYQYSRDPSKGCTCHRCGASISWAELFERGRCGKCNLALV